MTCNPELKLLVMTLFLLDRSELIDDASVELINREITKHGERLFYEMEYGNVDRANLFTSASELCDSGVLPVVQSEQVAQGCRVVRDWLASRLSEAAGQVGQADPVSTALVMAIAYTGRRLPAEDNLQDIAAQDCAFVESVLAFLMANASEADLDSLRTAIRAWGEGHKFSFSLPER